MTSRASVAEDDFGESDEPSVLSADPNERKLARRLRIQRRAEALQKLDAEHEEDEVVEESLTEKQILASAELLEKLIVEGDEVITNVRVANDAREIERRQEASDIREMLLQRLEESSEQCRRQYSTIDERWPVILGSNDPLDINAEMEAQRANCDQVLAQKDEVIAELKRELQRANNKYFEDQERQKEDIRLLTERIEHQMSTMEDVCTRELELIERTLKSERDTLIDNYQKKWDALYKQQEEEDAAGEKRRKEIMREYEEEMERVMTEHDEEFRAQKIELENQCQDLQRQVERTKATCLLNAEKLNYNYTVLKNREEENSIVKSQQKRKINKLQGMVNNLKKTHSDLEENTRLEIEKLSNQIVKAHKSITELEEKSNHFTRINEKQFLDIWNMNTENANELMEQILAADKIIHERTLGVLWEPPRKALPRKEDLPSYREAVNLIEKRKEEEIQRLKMFEYEKAESPSEIRLEREVLNNILKQISSCSGYLIEDKLQELIANRTEEEKTIIRLDNVFQALSISSPDEINILLNFFLPFSYCPICSKDDSTNSGTLSKSPDTSTKSTSCIDICDGCKDENVQRLIDSVKKEIEVDPDSTDEAERLDSFSSDNIESLVSEEYDNESVNKESKVPSKRFTCDQGHVLEIQAAHVTKAMKELVVKYNNVQEKEVLSFEERLKEKKFTISRNLSVQDIQTYWSSYREMFDDQKEKLWDAILIGLNKYYQILKERYKLCKESEHLKNQNIELQRLLESQTTCITKGSSVLEVKSAKHSECR